MKHHLLIAWLLLLSCALAQERIVPKSTTVQVPEGYRIQANDLLDVNIYEEATAQVRVGPTGKVRLPMVGEMKLTGLSLDQAARAVEAALQDGYLLRPTVSVQMLSYGAQHRFTVRGAVAKPGAYEIPPDKPLTLVEAIAIANPTEQANERKVTVQSTISPGKVLSLKFDVKAMGQSAGKVAPYMVRNGDIITVSPRLF